MKAPLAAAAFCAGYLAVYVLTALYPLPLLWHLPVEHRFVFTVRPNGLGADFYGRMLYALGAGCLCGALSIAFRTGLRTLFAWSVSLLALGVTLHLWTLSSRKPIPASLPVDYVAR